ncbi:MAG: electron transport complex subunit RsxC [Oscillospiraceae bacterium]|nr:electron transport complex subunit RsxC [Oscillospiraceae bacterium]
MKKLNSIKVPHNKNTQNSAVEKIPLPQSVKIPMCMNMGKPCTPTVKVKDTVAVGQKIGDCDVPFSVPVHSGVSGTVKSISDYRMIDGNNCKAIEIECDGLQTVSDTVKPPVITDRESFIKAVRESGMVGLGGAGFPTHIKLNPKNKIDTLLLNGAECEPYITSDYRTMLEHPDEMLDGIRIVAKMLEIPNVIIGIENNKPEAVKILKEKTANDSNINVMSLPSLYPQGGEKVLIYNCTGKIVEEGKLPSDYGIIVMNVSTAYALDVYFKTGMPLVSRTVTVDGDIIKKSGNYLVPVGTSIEYILDYAQCEKDKINKLITGGMMMGITIYDITQPVTKQNNAVLAFNKIEISEELPCIRCGRCMRACPLDLMPMELDKAYKKRDAESLLKYKVNLCMNCGCCTYVCPSKRKLAETNQLAKAFLRNKK